MGKAEGWKDAAVDALVVSLVGVGVAYFGIDRVVASGISGATEGAIPSALGRPLVFGVTIGLTVFIYDLVMLYK